MRQRRQRRKRRKGRRHLYQNEGSPSNPGDVPDHPCLQVIISPLAEFSRVGLCGAQKNKQAKPPPAATQGPGK